MEDPDFAAAQRWCYRHFFVDEFQDANPAQLRLLDAWLGERSDLFAVGDPRQAIYGWNGADASVMSDFEKRYAQASVLNLSTNYRSTPQLVAVADAALARSDRYPTQVPRPDGTVPSVVAYEDEKAGQVESLTSFRRAFAPGRPWSRCAVLARTNAQLFVFEEALHKVGIPTRSGSARSFLFDPAMRPVLASLDQKVGPTSFPHGLMTSKSRTCSPRRLDRHTPDDVESDDPLDIAMQPEESFGTDRANLSIASCG